MDLKHHSCYAVLKRAMGWIISKFLQEQTELRILKE
jgi:hypothetical protein